MPPRDELGEDRDGDLLLRGGPEVEAGRAAHPRERLLVDAALAKLGRQGPGALRARHEPDVTRAARQRRLQGLFVAAAHRGDDDRVGPLHRRRHVPAHHACQLSQRPGRRRIADDRKQECRAVGLDHHVDRAFRGAPALDPLTARLAVGERQEREPDDLGLRAGTADPAVQLAVLGHERPVADARRRRPLHPDHGGESERRSLLHEATGFDEDLHSASAPSMEKG